MDTTKGEVGGGQDDTCLPVGVLGYVYIGVHRGIRQIMGGFSAIIVLGSRIDQGFMLSSIILYQYRCPDCLC